MPESQSDPQALLEKIKSKYQTTIETLKVDSAEIQILDITDMKSRIDWLISTNKIHNPLRDLPLWAKIWPAALILGRFLRKFEPDGKDLLELGCGMGALSLVASQYGFKRILATDIEQDALDFANANMLLNGIRNMDIKKLDLLASGSFTGVFDIIAAAEILYLDELHKPILKFISKHLLPTGKALFCTDLGRTKPRFKKLASKNFNIQEGRIGVKGEDHRIYSILILEPK